MVGFLDSVLEGIQKYEYYVQWSVYKILCTITLFLEIFTIYVGRWGMNKYCNKYK